MPSASSLIRVQPITLLLAASGAALPKCLLQAPTRYLQTGAIYSLFGWLVADGWCWFVLREKYCCLVADGWFVLREKYCWLVADKPSEQGIKRAEVKNSCSR
jgi:hypothetical protein